MMTFLGRWRLIPEVYCDVDILHDTLQVMVTANYHRLSPFIDRLHHIKATRILRGLASSPN